MESYWRGLEDMTVLLLGLVFGFCGIIGALVAADYLTTKIFSNLWRVVKNGLLRNLSSLITICSLLVLMMVIGMIKCVLSFMNALRDELKQKEQPRSKQTESGGKT